MTVKNRGEEIKASRYPFAPAVAVPRYTKPEKRTSSYFSRNYCVFVLVFQTCPSTLRVQFSARLDRVETLGNESRKIFYLPV